MLKKAVKKSPEIRFQLEVVKQLKKLENKGLLRFFRIKNEQKSGYSRMLDKKAGFKNVPDLFVKVRNDRVVFIELKSKNGRQSKEQVIESAEWNKLGIATLVLQDGILNLEKELFSCLIGEKQC